MNQPLRFSEVTGTLFENVFGGTVDFEDVDNDGTGSFNPISGTPFPGTFVGATSFADFSNDEKADVLLVGTGTGGLADISIIANIYENMGSNNYVLADSLTGTYLSSTAIGDVDGDNDLDLVIAGTSTGFPVRATRMYTNLTPTTVSLVNKEKPENIDLFPNPSNGLINIKMKQAVGCTVNVYNLRGRLVYSSQNAIDYSTQIQLNLPGGIYMIMVKTQDLSLTKKLIMPK